MDTNDSDHVKYVATAPYPYPGCNPEPAHLACVEREQDRAGEIASRE